MLLKLDLRDSPASTYTLIYTCLVIYEEMRATT